MNLQVIQSKIYEIRGQRVMLDFDLAELYQVETRALKQAVRRNIERFPDDFLFRLSRSEANYLINIGVSQNVIPSDYNISSSEMFAFTEQGVSMLSSILRSPVAVQTSITIMRAFVVMRDYILSTRQITAELEVMREKILRLERADEDNIEAINDLSEDMRKDIDIIYTAIGELSARPPLLEKDRKRIGFKRGDE
ncbi:MAG: ORF6N domain-containing protein [Rikenellaceae bacterium]|nr:ORF6N domain-containing protein [Rikenellaceae bacterium]MCL2692227.1 ORF6N domain-containing protein [Rikenellaceae bacterium]